MSLLLPFLSHYSTGLEKKIDEERESGIEIRSDNTRRIDQFSEL